jgi:hypothetical protein
MKNLPLQSIIIVLVYFWAAATGYFIYKNHRAGLALDRRNIGVAALKGLWVPGSFVVVALPSLLHRLATLWR